MAFNWPADDLTVKEKVGVGMDTPTEKLEVKGNIKLNSGVAVGEFSSDGTFASPSNQSVPTTQAIKTYVDTQVATVNTALATKADQGGSLAQNFQANNLTVQGKLEVTGETIFRDVERHQGDLELGNEDSDQVKIRGKLLSTHPSGTLQVTSPIAVTGTVTATAFSGNGAGLTGLPLQWAPNGNNISYTSGNVGIGTTTPHTQLTLTGSLGFTNATTPMMYIFQSGTANPDRPIISHSPAFPNWGLMYRDADDKMIFQNSGTPVMTVDLGGQNVQVARGMTVGSVVMPTEVGRLVASGPVAEVVFVDRRLSTWPSAPQAGDRFLWYTANRVARLWTEQLGDVLAVDQNGRVGLRNSTPLAPFHLYSADNPTVLRIQSTGAFGTARIEFWSDPQGSPAEWRPGFIQSTDQGGWVGGLAFFVNGQGVNQRTGAIEVMRINQGVVKVNGVVQQSSSRSVKENVDQLSTQEAVTALEQLHPVKFNYKTDLMQEQHIGFIAEDVPDLVASCDRKFLNSMDIVAVLTKVLQEQQATIAALTTRLNALEAKQA